MCTMFIYFLTITFPHNVNVWHWNRFLILIKRMPRCSAFLSSPHWPHGTRVPAKRDVVVPVLIINFQLWSLIPTKKALREFADLSPAPVKDGSGSEQSCRGWNGERVTLITPPNRNECLARTGDRRGRGGSDSQTRRPAHSGTRHVSAVVSAGPVHFPVINGSAFVTNRDVSLSLDGCAECSWISSGKQMEKISPPKKCSGIISPMCRKRVSGDKLGWYPGMLVFPGGQVFTLTARRLRPCCL